MLIKKWENYLENQEKSTETIKNYIIDINMMFSFLKKSDTIENVKNITVDNLEDFILYLKNSRKNSPSSRTRRINTIKSFYNFLIKKKYISSDKNITNELEIPKKVKREMQYLTEDEAKKLIKLVDGTNKIRDRAIIMLFLNTGLRLAELLSIKIDDIKDGSLTVIGKGNKQRTVMLNDNTVRYINEYLQQRPNVKANELFVSNKLNKLSRSCVQHMIKNNLKKIGKENLSTHKLRHTAATLLLKKGNNIRVVQDILGHSDIATTSIYLHIDIEDKKNASNSIDLSIWKNN